MHATAKKQSGMVMDLKIGESVKLGQSDGSTIVITAEPKQGQLVRLRLQAPESVRFERDKHRA